MKVIERNKKTGYRDDSIKFFNLKRYEKNCGDFVLVEGAFEEAHQWEQFGFTKKELDKIFKKRIVRLEFEEPNKFHIGDNPDHYDHYFYKIFTICPYTAKWLNKRQGNSKRIPFFYPVNEKYIPPKTKKIYDVVYVGNLVSPKLFEDLNVIKKFNYRLVSFSKHPLVTDHDVSYQDKLKLISQSKVALIQNVLFPQPYHIFNIWRAKDWQENEAFRMIPPPWKFWKIFTDKNIVIPQVKTRLFETALSRTLILCKKDKFNIIERFFEPNKEFIYYNEHNLDKMLRKILSNYDFYAKIAERAYKKAKRKYTTKALVEDYLSKI